MKVYDAANIRNVALVGHSGSGKTQLTSAALFGGMTVAVRPNTPAAEHEGTTYWFCCPGCRGRFARDPAKYLART